MSIAVTVDLDWACEPAIAELLDFLQDRGIPSTVFVTHRSPRVERSLHELEVGLHPNFAPDSSHGGTLDAVVEHVLGLPHTIPAYRCHRFAASNVVVANSAYYGSGMKIAPAATVSDGVLDVVVIEAASKLALMRSLPKVYDGGHIELPEVTVLSGRRVELRADAKRPVPVGGDGEPLGQLPGLADAPAVVEVQPGVLSVITG